MQLKIQSQYNSMAIWHAEIKIMEIKPKIKTEIRTNVNYNHCYIIILTIVIYNYK